MASEINNKFLINAPAGSGKTTSIRKRLCNINLAEPNSKILCITYTNRAVEELSKNLDNSNIEIYTIHSYINKLVSPYFKEKEVINFYFDFYKKNINDRITNIENKPNIQESNAKYCEKYSIATFDFESIKRNLKEISYGEIPFTSFYYGKLSHDDLIIFASKLCKKFPVILKKIYLKYKYVFLDEYQDTPTEILDMFNCASNKNKNLKVYLFGDRMQQIYPNYDGSFEEQFSEFNVAEKLETNYRSVKPIVDILNRIYNDESFEQNPSEENLKLSTDILPTLIFTNDQERTIKSIENEFPKALKLYLMNSEKYNEIGSLNLYNVYNKMEAYSFGKKLSANDILSDISTDNPDLLFSCLLLIYQIIFNYKNNDFGAILSTFKTSNKLLNKNAINLHKNSDKTIIKNILQQCYEVYENEETTVKDILKIFTSKNLLNVKFQQLINEIKDYIEVLNVKLVEFKNLITFLNDVTVSTQHGVKGESHNSVIFIVNENKNKPNVRTYDFFKLWCDHKFSLPELEKFYFDYKNNIEEFEIRQKFNHSLLNANYYSLFADQINIYVNETLSAFKNDKFFNYLYLNNFNRYNNRKNVTNAKKVFTYTEIEGILFAYKIFYVGCSRARKNLIIVADRSKLINFENKLKSKLEQIGFKVEIEPIQE